MESITAFLKWGGHTQEDCVVLRKGFADQHGFKIGDRLHFSKHENGIVSLLLPDDEMSRSEEGTIPDILVAYNDREY
jgi:DNA-directed RNA polymerase beta subunit